MVCSLTFRTTTTTRLLPRQRTRRKGGYIGERRAHSHIHHGRLPVWAGKPISVWFPETCEFPSGGSFSFPRLLTYYADQQDEAFVHARFVSFSLLSPCSSERLARRPTSSLGLHVLLLRQRLKNSCVHTKVHSARKKFGPKTGMES